MIQHLLFDFGDVLYKIDQTKTLSLFKEYIGNQSFIPSLNLNDFLSVSFFKDFETGKINAEVFRDEVRKYFNIKISDTKFDKFWNATLIAPFVDSYDLLLSLKNKYTISLLSNTNEIHYNRFYPECKDFLSLFDHQFYSHKIGFMKPDTNAFHYVLNKLNTQAENVLFIDDLKRNTVAAKKLGINVFLFNYEKNRKELLNFLGIV